MVSKICTLGERAASNRVLEAKADEAEKLCLLTVGIYYFFLKCRCSSIRSGVDRQEKQLIHRYISSTV